MLRKRNGAAKRTLAGMLFERCVNACVLWVMQEEKPENWLQEARRGDKKTTPAEDRSTTTGTSLAPHPLELGSCSICSALHCLWQKGPVRAGRKRRLASTSRGSLKPIWIWGLFGYIAGPQIRHTKAQYPMWPTTRVGRESLSTRELRRKKDL
ncbi:hypothetical protein M413DRAFT_234839 [Hebeloma cylindrosporum]|uniref:Uncharacterized protein n=1 Tax=Hebeloma cylindrosporum TaxID=76867 RepID=A0A0C2XMW9_HEBCY|nr:hypothetical protein M413DRAFT_234839 [Hebeloma cylindrosporum h7]